MTKLKLNLMIMLMLYLFAGSMRAEKNLTVYEGTDTQGMIPVAGGTFNYYNKSQYVIPAAQLTDMVGSNIYALAYHLTTDNDNEMMEGSVNVYIKEVSYTTISSFEPVVDQDLYYQGQLTLSKVGNERMILMALKTPYFYKGGNLLIDFENPEKGETKSKKFYGKKVKGASIAVFDADKSKLESKTPNQYDFIPTTTFMYYPCPVITGVNTTPTSATINWTGENNSYQLRYSEMSFFDDFEDGFDNWTVVRNGGGTANTDWQLYGNPYQGKYSAVVRSWYDGTAYTTDTWLISPQVTLGGTLKYWVRDDGKYHEEYNVYISTTGNDTKDFTLLAAPGNATSAWAEVSIDLSAYEGKTGYIAFRDQNTDQDYLQIDNVGICHNVGEWTDVKDVEAPYTIDKLKEDQAYLMEVKGFSANEYETPWTQCAVITHGNPTPYDVKVSLDTHDATISWTGFGDSYQLAYKTADKKNIMTQGFENGYDGWKRVECHAKSGGNANSAVCRTGQVGFAFYSDKVTEPQYLISPRMATTADGTKLSFYYKNYHSGCPESFTVGYSSTTDDIDAFSFGDETTTQACEWLEFNEAIPAGTKYICIKYTSQDMHYLFLDDIETYLPQTATDWNIVTDITSASTTIDGLDPDTQYEFLIRSIKNRTKGKNASDWINTQYFKTQAALQLANNDANLAKKNIDILEENWNKMAEVQLTDRTLLKDGFWNTLCLPFSLSAEQIAASSLAGATIKTLNNAIDGTSLSNDGTLTLKFNTVTDIEAGVPYLIRWNKADGYDQADKNTRDIKDPVFTGVTITCTEPISIVSDDEKVSFVGQYSPFEIVNSGATGNNQGNKNEILLMSSGNKIGYSKNARTIDNGKALKCFRSHFKVATENGQQARNFVLDFDEGYETTGILVVEEDIKQQEENWYTIDGRKLDKMPTKKGLYISNGKKFTK